MGKLTLIPTPIGNLEDITLRALRTLKEVEILLCEDTRTTGQLLKHYQIEQNLQAYHQHNEHQTVQKWVDELKNSPKHIGLVTDAGTPAISDPGFLLVRQCLAANIEVECLVGAVAFVPALVKSGLPSEKFCFEGFIPQKKGRQTYLKAIESETRTLIFYESPHRILKTLEDFKSHFEPERKISVSRELTKLYEETFSGTIPEAIEHFNKKIPKGEFVIVLQGKNDTPKQIQNTQTEHQRCL